MTAFPGFRDLTPQEWKRLLGPEPTAIAIPAGLSRCNHCGKTVIDDRTRADGDLQPGTVYASINNYRLRSFDGGYEEFSPIDTPEHVREQLRLMVARYRRKGG